MIDPRDLFVAMFEAAVSAADPSLVMHGFLPKRPKGRTIVIGAGKGSSQMAAAFEAVWDGPLEGVVVTRYNYATPCERIRVIEAAHPVPDAAGLAASQALFDAVQGLSEDDLVAALASGGGSALLPSPPASMTLADELVVNQALLTSGSPISAMNTVRKHLSKIKGGRLALAAYPARVITPVASDIPGDNPAFVASGPTVADRATREGALPILSHYDLRLPQAALDHLASDACRAPLPDDPRLVRNETHVIASAARSFDAAAAVAKSHGVQAIVLSDAMEGEARDVGSVHAAIAREIVLRDRPFPKPVVFLSGRETTVTIRKAGGKGGRSTELLLSLASGIAGINGVHAFAADTDGIDGSQQNAGAFADGRSAERLRCLGLDAKSFLASNVPAQPSTRLATCLSPAYRYPCE